MGDQKAEDDSVINYKAADSWSWRDGLICITDSYASSPLFNNGYAGIVAAAPYYEATIEAMGYSLNMVIGIIDLVQIWFINME